MHLTSTSTANKPQLSRADRRRLREATILARRRCGPLVIDQPEVSTLGEILAAVMPGLLARIDGGQR